MAASLAFKNYQHVVLGS